MAGEFDFLDWVRDQHRADDFVRIPQGDDLAALKWSGDDLLLVGVDQVLEGIHFDLTIHSPLDVGRKAMNRNLSDCAAMGCVPRAALVSVALTRGCGIDFAKQLYNGLRSAADPFDCRIVGGDTGSWDGKLVVTVSIFGSCNGWNPAQRNGARAGDRIYVTGPLGGSMIGGNGLGRHMTFEPRVKLGIELAQSGKVTSMMDLSDGLSRDLNHICRQSKVGALLLAENIPMHPDAVELSRRDNISALDHALNDGEDYELLFTAKPGEFDSRFKSIGRIVETPGLHIHRDGAVVELKAMGWEHGV